MSERRRGRISLVSVGVVYGAMVLAAVVGSRALFDRAPLVIGDDRAPTWISVALGIGLGGAVVLISAILNSRFAWSRRISSGMREILGPMTPSQVSVVAVTSALGEELLFRGLLLPLTGLTISSIIFGLLHIGPRREFWPWTLMAVGMGFALGGVTLATGDVMAAILAHLTINYFNLLAITGPERG